jgi:hypothetical protein
MLWDAMLCLLVNSSVLKFRRVEINQSKNAESLNLQQHRSDNHKSRINRLIFYDGTKRFFFVKIIGESEVK